MKEAYIEKKCVDLAKTKGYEVRKMKFIACNGAPDRFFFKKGRSFWVEFKAPDGVISEIQKYQQKLLTDAGQEVHNIFSIDQFKEVLNVK